MNKFCYLLLIVFGLAACGAPEVKETAVDEDGNKYFGEKIEADGAISMSQLKDKMATTDSVKVKLTGTIESVCQKKGCWMNIVSEETGDDGIFVKFKDYGFFMPLDATGKNVIMDGYAFKEVTPVDELRHYAEDEGASEEEIAAITEPKEELKFMASGVIITN